MAELVEAEALGCRYYRLVSSISLTRSHLSFNFMHKTVPQHKDSVDMPL